MQGRVLIIAGSDSGGGAGIQADLKTVMALGGYGMTAVTAVTVQNTQGVGNVYPLPPQAVTEQMETVLDDIGADCIKTGMLHDAPLIEAVAKILRPKAKDIPLVADPVMAAKGGRPLLENDAAVTLKKEILPLAALLTPNVPEAEILLQKKIADLEAMRKAACDLAALGPKAVLLKGGHLPGGMVTDVLWDGTELHEWQSPRIPTTRTHGTGCTLASAIATARAQGLGMKDAVARARDYVRGAILNAPRLGQGHGPLNHGWMMEKQTQTDG